MRTVAYMLAVAFCLPPAARAQSLADVAKKEKERRDALKSESAVIDDAALRTAKGDGLSVTGAEVDEPEDAEEAEDAGARAPSSSSSRRDPAKPSPAELRARRKNYAESLSRARASVESLRESVKNCRQSARRPSAFLGAVDCSSVEQSLRHAQDALRDLQARRP